MMKLSFYKYQGTGNDFILLDNRNKSISLSVQQIKQLCDRRFGIGADGLMLLELEPGVDFKMVYFNSDGKESSMCGNGGRCIVAFAKYLNIIDVKARFLAIDGIHDAFIDEQKVSLKMNDVRNIEQNDEGYYLNTGSPHYVKFITDISNYNVVEEGRNIRYNERFLEEGTNVNFIEIKDTVLEVRTYERGVEDETYSCGTGVTAAALVASIKGFSTGKNTCRVYTKGGELDVRYDKVLENNFYNIWLDGPVDKVFEGVIDIQDEL